ncbi:pro-Pol polyprotein [Trichonephila clavipes]|nr:pro-Pol polyprotein [Trichonephila clavipes]
MKFLKCEMKCMHLAGHLGEQKTKQRIKYSFFWPLLKGDVKTYCEACKPCLLRRTLTYRNRILIQPIVRPNNPFEVWSVDCIGLLEPRSGRGHSYIVCAIDLCSRWAEAIPTKNITAKTTCEVLMKIFIQSEFSKTICTDQGTNFTAQLTQAFQNVLGASPRFSTPGRPEKIPHILTGVSPYQLVYGRLPSELMSILKEFWTGEREIPTSGARCVEENLKQLQKKLQDAHEITSGNSTKNQEHKETEPNIGIELNQMPDVLNSQQKHQLRKLLQQYEDIFRNRPGKANVKGHSVKVTADSSPKRLQPYRVPIALQKEVERQVHDMD